jgi:DNA-binding GntR family transcriptional regulator
MRLKLTATDEVMRIRRIRHLDNGPTSYEEVVLPLSRLPGIGHDGALPSDMSELARQYSFTLGSAREHASTVRVRKDVAAHLRLSEGARVLKLDRVLSTADGTPIEWRVSFSVARE